MRVSNERTGADSLASVALRDNVDEPSDDALGADG